MTNIVPIHQAQTGRLKALNNLAAEADLVAMRYDQLENLTGIIREKAPKKGEQLDKLKQTATLDKTDEELLERCTQALELLDANENYQDNDPEGALRRHVVSGRLATLIGAFPNSSSVGDPETYARAMVENVYTVDGLSLVALDAACHEIVATHKFLPTVSELLKVLKDQAAKWERRFWAISSLADTSRRVVARIEALERRRR